MNVWRETEVRRRFAKRVSELADRMARLKAPCSAGTTSGGIYDDMLSKLTVYRLLADMPMASREEFLRSLKALKSHEFDSRDAVDAALFRQLCARLIEAVAAQYAH